MVHACTVYDDVQTLCSGSLNVVVGSKPIVAATFQGGGGLGSSVLGSRLQCGQSISVICRADLLGLTTL